MDKKQDEIIMVSEDGENVNFRVVEQTRLGGTDYLLVTTMEDEEEALILKDISVDTDEEAVYSIVEEEQELESVTAIFRELLDDIELC